MRLIYKNNRNRKQESFGGLIRLVGLLSFVLVLGFEFFNNPVIRLESNASHCETTTTTETGPLPVSTRLPLAEIRQQVTQSDISLAQRQSFGYFDDMSDEAWMRAQRIQAKMFPNHAPQLEEYSNPVVIKDMMKELKWSSFWYAQNFHEEFHCPNAQRVPTDGDGDGPKWVCDPHRLKTKKDCLVYSVGSNGKAEFEQGVKDEIGSHCEIHTFDLRKFNPRFGGFAQALKGLSTFHHWGFGTPEQVKSSTRYKTLQQTMKELGHENRTIDLFKIDCEWCEWFTYDQWLKEDIRQILVETHNAPMPNARDFFFRLHDAGFAIFSKEANFQNGGGCVEYGFVKLSTDFFVNGSVYGPQTR